ncbi:MAG: bifunctional 5,10-methylenetetrahydrofolate dehydrogenase/5,10-methenyltetrahydrofolate cyclohydrolase [Chloroflexota bacterium]
MSDGTARDGATRDGATLDGAARVGPARILDGTSIATEFKAVIRSDVAAFVARYGRVPALAVVAAGSDAPSMVYLRQILKSCETVGIEGRLIELGDDTTPTSLAAAVATLNADPQIAGIIVQMPLPRGLPLRAVIDVIDPVKDIDGIHPLNAGLLRLGYDGFLPATAHAAVEMLRRSDIPIAGRTAVVIGRSAVVGMPAAFLLVKADATVTVCHSKTVNLAEHVRRADIVVTAAGHPGLITGSMLKPGAVVIDVGINVVGGRLVGDVDFASASTVASAITPVPGGVGPLTNALLLSHLIAAARRQAGEVVPTGVRST